MTNLSYYKLFFKAVSNQTRLDIVELLKTSPKNVTQICDELGVEQSRVSKALGCLTHCGFVSARWDKGNKIYSINGEVLPILRSIDKHLLKYQKQLIDCGTLKRRK